MEDAMIINQASIDRGFMHGRVIKTEIISLDDFRSKKKFGTLDKLSPKMMPTFLRQASATTVSIPCVSHTFFHSFSCLYCFTRVCILDCIRV